MLRKIISLYKAIFLLIFGLMLAGSLAYGFYLMIEGQNPTDRWEGVNLMIFGSLFVLALAGNLALVLENNELLRRIAEQGERGQQSGGRERSGRPDQRSEPSMQRKEPTL